MSDSTTDFPTSTLPRCSTAGPPGRRHLVGLVRSVGELTPDERERMYTLLTLYFHKVTPTHFERDLAEKEHVILLRDERNDQIQGFSTLKRLRTTVDGRPIAAFFSGDTIVERAYWGESVLSRLWARHVFREAAAIRHTAPGTQVFWFLICSGYKTYRFLPTFFRSFYPAYDRSTPPATRRILDSLAGLKFPNEYDAERGIVRLSRATPLRPEVAAITTPLLRNPHVAFFAAANPGHIDGDELACLTEIIPDNLTPAGRRMLGI